MPVQLSTDSNTKEKQLPRRRELPTRVVGQELLVRDPQSGQVHFLSATAALIWDCCDGQTSFAECASRLNAAFAIPEGVDIGADIREALDDFARRGLLDA
jgi:PqqD family protein of HPr-rel-A system